MLSSIYKCIASLVCAFFWLHVYLIIPSMPLVIPYPCLEGMYIRVWYLESRAS